MSKVDIPWRDENGKVEIEMRGKKKARRRGIMETREIEKTKALGIYLMNREDINDLSDPH